MLTFVGRIRQRYPKRRRNLREGVQFCRQALPTSGILRGVDAPEQWRERFQREQLVRHSLRAAAERLESAEQERVVNIAAAHHTGLSVRQIASVVRLSPARVHQLLHAPVSSAAVRATTMR